MKIAVDVRDANKEKTGKGWYAYNLLNEILKRDKKNEYLLYSNTSNNPFKEHKNATLKTIETKTYKWHMEVIKDIQKEKVDIFFAPTSYIIPALAPKNIRVVMTVHDLVAFLFPGTHNTKAVLIERLTLNRALKKASAIFVVSENTKKDLLKKFQFPENHIYLTHCAPADFYKEKISEEEAIAFKNKFKLPDHFILSVGTLEPRKNFSTLIKSLVLIKKWHPEYKLVIVGKQGWKFENIEETLKKFGLEKEVIFTGYLKEEELRIIYKLAKVFVFPSLYEGFGIPPLEAMASGCPVVSSNVASLPEVIGDAGLLIDPTNSYKMADAISGLLENENACQTMISRGYEQSEKFSWKDSAAIALDAFNEIGA